MGSSTMKKALVEKHTHTLMGLLCPVTQTAQSFRSCYLNHEIRRRLCKPLVVSKAHGAPTTCFQTGVTWTSTVVCVCHMVECCVDVQCNVGVPLQDNAENSFPVITGSVWISPLWCRGLRNPTWRLSSPGACANNAPCGLLTKTNELEPIAQDSNGYSPVYDYFLSASLIHGHINHATPFGY